MISLKGVCMSLRMFPIFCIFLILVMQSACSSFPAAKTTATNPSEDNSDLASLLETENANMATLIKTLQMTTDTFGVSGQENTPSTGSGAAKAGEVIVDGDLRLFVGGWVEIPPNSEIIPANGYKVIAVELTLVYAGKQTYNYSPSDISIKDPSMRAYSSAGELDLTSYPLISSAIHLSHGERIRRFLRFQVPIESPGLVLVYSGENNNLGKISVELDDQPGLQPPPHDLPGEVAPSGQALGSIASCSGLNIQINDAKYAKPSYDLITSLPLGVNRLIIDVAIENVDTTVHFFGSWNWLMDSSGVVYGSSASFENSDSNYASQPTLQPGETIEGWMGFNIPENTDPGSLTLAYWCGKDSNPVTGEKVYLSLH
jgi:hypothetical protein